MSPLAEKSRRFNPYTYALNNPVYFIGPDGMEAQSPIFDNKTGAWLGNDSTGFMGDEVLFMDADKYKELSKNSENGVIDHEVAVDNSQAISQLESTEKNMVLFNKATDFIDKVLYKVFYGQDITKDLIDGKVQVASKEVNNKGTNWGTWVDDEYGNYRFNGYDIVTQNFENRKILNTAGNIFSNFEHEFRGHGNKFRGKEMLDFDIPVSSSHSTYKDLEYKAIYQMQMRSSNFKFTSGTYKKHILNQNK